MTPVPRTRPWSAAASRFWTYRLGFVTLYCLSIGFLPEAAWAQRSRTPANPTTQELRRPEPVPVPTAVSPITFPETDPSSALGKALTLCVPSADTSELSLPATKGEIKLDRCYRGRDHLVCQFKALTGEAKSLLENYRQIIDANYAEVRDFAGICALNSDALARNLQNAAEFETRFKAFKAAYDARSACANRIQQSMAQVAFPDMVQGPSLVKFMTDGIEADVKGVSEMQGELANVGEKMAHAQKAMVTLQKIHRAMCMARAPAATLDNPSPAASQDRTPVKR